MPHAHHGLTGLAPTHTALIHTPTGGAVDASHPAYQKRLARAKTMNKSSTEPGAERAPSQFSLNLSGLSASLGEPPAEGDHKLGAGDQGILTTPRADQDVAITVRGAPKLAILSKAAHSLAEIHTRGKALLCCRASRRRARTRPGRGVLTPHLLSQAQAAQALQAGARHLGYRAAEVCLAAGRPDDCDCEHEGRGPDAAAAQVRARHACRCPQLRGAPLYLSA